MRIYQRGDVACVMQSDARNGATISAANPLRDAIMQISRIVPLPDGQLDADPSLRASWRFSFFLSFFFSFLWRNESLGSEAGKGYFINCFRSVSLTLLRYQHFCNMSICIWKMTVLRSVWGKQGCAKRSAVTLKHLEPY